MAENLVTGYLLLCFVPALHILWRQDYGDGESWSEVRFYTWTSVNCTRWTLIKITQRCCDATRRQSQNGNATILWHFDKKNTQRAGEHCKCFRAKDWNWVVSNYWRHNCVRWQKSFYNNWKGSQPWSYEYIIFLLFADVSKSLCLVHATTNVGFGWCLLSRYLKYLSSGAPPNGN